MSVVGERPAQRTIGLVCGQAVIEITRILVGCLDITGFTQQRDITGMGLRLQRRQCEAYCADVRRGSFH